MLSIRTLRSGAVLTFALLALAGGSLRAEAAKPASEKQVEARLVLVKRLTQESSAARQVKGSANAEAVALYADAKSLYDQALKASDAGDYSTANDLLSRSSKAMFAAVRKASPREVLDKKRVRDYENRLASVNALLDAHDRVSTEKGALADHTQLRGFVERQITAAKTLLEKGDPAAGRKTLDEAYVAIKVAIESLRGGDTLVRALSFATKQEEYHYELDRNDSHRMLVTVLLKEKMDASAGVKKIVQMFMDKSLTLREQAEEMAATGDFEAAVDKLEDSTGQIVRAIRGAGIYIPGG